jgi:hypothetical protein
MSQELVTSRSRGTLLFVQLSDARLSDLRALTKGDTQQHKKNRLRIFLTIGTLRFVWLTTYLEPGQLLTIEIPTVD